MAGVAGGPALDPGEELLIELRGIGAVMLLTDGRLIVARDGLERRPRSGILAFPLAGIVQLRLEIGRSPSGRIAVSTVSGQEAVSMFFDSRSLGRAQELIDVARPLIARHRRRAGQGFTRPSGGLPDEGSEPA